MDILKSRRFWLLVIDFVVIVGGFVLRSYAPQYQDAIVLIVGAAQPLVMYLLSKFTQDDTMVATALLVAKTIGKSLPVAALLALVIVGGANVASAAPPDLQPWMVAAASQGIGGSTPEAVQVSFGRFQNAQAAKFQYTTANAWITNYDTDVSQFLRAHGCATCGISDGVLSYPLKISLPVGVLDFYDIAPVALQKLLGK